MFQSPREQPRQETVSTSLRQNLGLMYAVLLLIAALTTSISSLPLEYDVSQLPIGRAFFAAGMSKSESISTRANTKLQEM